MPTLTGVVQSGASNPTPISGATVRLYAAHVGSPVMWGEATTDGNGAFSIPDPAVSTDSIFYVTATLGGGVQFLALLGPTIPASIVLNELTTVAGAYCAAQFLVSGGVQGEGFRLQIAAGMSTNIVDLATGASSAVMSSSPNADETNAWRTTLSLANVLASCVNVRKNAAAFLALTTPEGGPPPTDTITALGNLARKPAFRVGAIYKQSKLKDLYQPDLREQPDAWTIAVKVNDSGDDAHMFGGPGNVAFDSQGRAWIANNVIQGTGNSTLYSIVLDATGRPATDRSGRRISPFAGGGLLGPGFGVDVDSKGHVWFGDFGWGKFIPPGGASRFASDATPLSPEPDGYGVGIVHRVQGTAVDRYDNVWLAGWGNATVAVFRGGDPGSVATYTGDASFKPFGIAFAKDGSAWVTSSDVSASGITRLRLNDSPSLEPSPQIHIGKDTKGIGIDSAGNIWVASGGDDHVYVFDSEGQLMGGFQGGGIWGPWGLTLDGDDNVWVANFGPLEIGSVVHGRLTQLAGINATGHRLGDGLTPQSGYTLPSAGKPVTLHNGDPLYGPGGPPSFIPMMRTTGLNIDAAGNVWTCNNWKPSFDNDLFGEPPSDEANPGGDGMVIWVGVAAPRKG